MPLNSAIAAYIHYLSFALIFASLTLEHQTFKPELTVKEGWRMIIADTLYGIAAIAILVTGALRVMYFGQGPSFYSQNPIFWVKIGIFIAVGLLSLYPTISYLRWVKGLRADTAPVIGETQAKVITGIIRAELLGFALIPLFASLMARGIGLT
ncbi:DUF2214 family protein [Spirulina major CS-329]|uniref:DUF2214 family protein n=1 Tax=Spirulina TaxID=1154 RepID=UPI00232AE2CF|nr:MULTISPECIES: DUF2214 family protein [Spirulina]MDB9495963.1 DUF2214 family protein [Spirulina subsalsa CS-330]MDB9502484.1 DUF2214 family protein [Spirulina major CS-329]